MKAVTKPLSICLIVGSCYFIDQNAFCWFQLSFIHTTVIGKLHSLICQSDLWRSPVSNCRVWCSSPEDDVSAALHSAFTHLDNKNSCIRMLFVDFTSAVITVSPMKLTGKLNWTWLPRSATGYWAGLTSRPWRVHIGIHNSSTLVLNTGAPQGCVLSLLLFTLYTTTALPAFKRTTPHLLFSVSKTKELVVEFRKKEAKTHTAVYMSGAEVEQVNISTRQSPAWSHQCSAFCGYLDLCCFTSFPI